MKKSVLFSIATVTTVALAIGVKNLYDQKIDQTYESGVKAGKTELIKAQEDFKSSPVFSPDHAWDSERNRIYIEYDIRMNTTNSEGAVSMVGAACFSSSVVNQWSCVARKTGSVIPQLMAVEVNPKTGYWSTINLF